MANLARVAITKPKGATVTLSRRSTDTSNTVALTVNKSSIVSVADEAVVPTTWKPNAWAVGTWK